MDGCNWIDPYGQMNWISGHNIKWNEKLMIGIVYTGPLSRIVFPIIVFRNNNWNKAIKDGGSTAGLPPNNKQ